MTRNSSTHVTLVYLHAHERSTSMMCWPYELAAYPLSMFNADGKMNAATSKSTVNTNYKRMDLNTIAQSQILSL